MRSITELARAKINLTLDVLRRRPDGYHEVEMIMQTLELADTISISSTEQGIVLETGSTDIPPGQDNIAWRAARLMVDSFGGSGGLKICLHKNIPVAAGLAGGSTDAAAVLRGINRLWELGLATEELCDLGARLGSDVPFCVREGTALATGRGEIIHPLAPCPEFWIVLVKPPVGVSTAEVYGKFEQGKVLNRPDNAAMREAIGVGDREGISAGLCNVLESVTLSLVPEVGDIKRALLRDGAINALMSGSGPTVFGIARDKEHACQLAQGFSDKNYTKIITRTVSNSNRRDEA